MTDTPFARSGFLARIRPGATISRYHVLGERSSGTNFAKRLLGRNSDLTPTELLGWKHGFPHGLGIPQDLVVIGMVRKADDWARSMHVKPWHCSPHMQSLDFSDFIRCEWDTYVDRFRYFPEAKKMNVIGEPLQHDRHPITGRKFANIFKLRQAKLAGLLGYLDRNCSFILIKMETATAQPQDTADKILQVIGATRTQTDFRPVHKRLGSNFKASVEDRPSTPKELSAEDMAFLKKQVSLSQEQALGYTY